MTKHQAYLGVFRFLDSYYFKNQNDGLGSLLGDMDPNIFGNGEMPADPAVWEDWQKCTEKVCGRDDVVSISQLKPLLFTFLEMYRDEWGYELDQVILALQNDPNLDNTLNQYAFQ